MDNCILSFMGDASFHSYHDLKGGLDKMLLEFMQLF